MSPLWDDSRQTVMAMAENDRKAETILDFFLRSVGYPGRAQAGESSFVLSVDGMEIRAEAADGRVILSYMLTDDETALGPLSEYAAGRMLKEDAVLTWDGGAMLWQDVPAGAGGSGFRRLFEAFLDSCDWWRARVEALRSGGASPAEPETMVIRP